MSAIEEILKNCSGVRVETIQHESSHWRSAQISYKFYKTGDIRPNDDIFIEIIGTATNGTIARVVDVEIKTYAEQYPELTSDAPNQLITYTSTIIYEVDGRKQKGRIKDHHVNILLGQHQTKYVRNVKQHEKVIVKNPVNKFKQEMKRGDWVIGIRQGRKTLSVGRITRWTNHNVWGVTGDDLDDKTKEFQFQSITETVTIPPDEASSLLTMAVLKGWNGR